MHKLHSQVRSGGAAESRMFLPFEGADAATSMSRMAVKPMFHRWLERFMGSAAAAANGQESDE